MRLSKKHILLIVGPLFILMGLFLDQKQKTPYEDVLRTPKISTPTSLDTATATPVSVVRVVDGDTISVLLDGSETKVRLIGINAPESVDPRRPVQCFGKEAAAHMTELLSQHKVELLYDISQDRYDKYGRLLAYVYRDDGVFINEAMIHDGYAYEYTYKTPYEFQQEFKTTEREARSEANGLWSPLTCNGRY